MLDGPSSLRASIVHSQIALHAQYGGVVPELASRAHIMAIDAVVNEALAEAGCTLRNLDAVAVTSGPGLLGALLTGIEYGKGLALALDLPLLGVNHLEGHLLAPFLRVADGFSPPAFPFVGLVVSGGHTSIVLARAPGRYEELGRTLDDAAGEAYDKVSKLLGMGYPGGAVIDARARRGNPDAIPFPRPMLKKGGANFSFSGLKTAVAQLVAASPPEDDAALDDLCASFQEAVADVLSHKLIAEARRHRVRTVVVTGGVASNSRLRELTLERATSAGIAVAIPPPSLCTDNAAMIGAAAWARLAREVAQGHRFDAWTLDAVSSWPLGEPPPVRSRA